MEFGIIADIALVLILAIFAFVNLKKGFTKQVLAIAVTIGSLLIAYFFSDDILLFLDNQFSLTDKLADKILGAFGENAALTAELSLENLKAAITEMGLPAFIAEFAEKSLETVTGGYENIGQFISHVLSHYILVAVSFVATWIIARIILGFVKKIVAKIVNIPGLHFIDKTLGFALGIIKGIIVVYVIIYVIEIIPSSVSQISAVKDALSASTLGGLLKEYNLVSIAFTWIVDKFKF